MTRRVIRRVGVTIAAMVIDGENVLALWKRTFSNTSDLKLQLYVDRTWRRDIPSTIHDELITTDVDFQP